MASDPPLSHDALLTLARKTEAAARDGDRDRLTAAAHSSVRSARRPRRRRTP